MERPEMRASDRDRAAVEDLLRRSHLEGRLTVDELEERLDRAHHAVTLADLEALHADLPWPRPSVPTRRRRPPRAPGIAPFTERVPLEAGVEVARDQALTSIAPPLSRYGYVLVEHTRHSLLFMLRRRPAWTILVAIFAFPIGLLALTVREEYEVVIDFEPRPDGGTMLTA